MFHNDVQFSFAKPFYEASTHINKKTGLKCNAYVTSSVVQWM